MGIIRFQKQPTRITVNKKAAKESPPLLEIEIDFLGGDKEMKMINEFMHTSGTFEQGKQYAKHNRGIYRGCRDNNIPKLCKKLR